MFCINRLRLEINTNDTNPDARYGFDISFKSGLNIIAGENTRGKTTISSCIYYSLGMEELLGGLNDKALGKALKTQFDVYDLDINEWRNKTVLASRVYIEISGHDGSIFTLRRIIKSGDLDPKVSSGKTKFIEVFESDFDSIATSSRFPLFLRNNNNNENDFGFYYWFAQTIGIEIPTVTNFHSADNESPLYLQTIFPALFIEQTKGWSGFLATMPFFGIPANKEKAVAYLLGLKDLSISSELEKLGQQEKKLSEKWKLLVTKIENLVAENNAHVENLPQDISIEKNDLNFVKIVLYDENRELLMSIKNAIDEGKIELDGLNSVPIRKVGENKATVRIRLEELHAAQVEFLKKFEEFDSKLNVQIMQKDSIGQQLISVNGELSRLKGVRNVVENAVLENIYDNCPKCHQKVSQNLMFNENVKIEQLTLEENIVHLTGQQKIMENSVASLNKIISEKRTMRNYFIKRQREFEDDIKVVLAELISDDRDYSATQTLNRVKLEKRISDLMFLEGRVDEMLRELEKVSDSYKSIIEQREDFKQDYLLDIQILERFEKAFKDTFLFNFGYDSNFKSQIYVQQTQPFKYFPVYKLYEQDKLPQSIKTNSSASDFVRTIWAYSLALLIGENHPGVIVFDEPGQHKIKSDSLKKLFETTSKIKTRQIIIFSSVDKVLSNDNGEVDKLDLDELLVNLAINEDYHIYRIPDSHKSIDLLVDTR